MSETVAVRQGSSWAELNRRVNALVTTRDGEWCGFPMPLPGLGLIVEDRSPHKAKLALLQEAFDRDEPKTHDPLTDEQRGWSIVNSWDSPRHQGRIVVLRHTDGRTTWGLDPWQPARNRMLLGPLETMEAWHLDTELTAIDKLAELLTERMYHAYVLTGQFLETSRRSGLTYLFRRCRPTVVLTPHKGDEMRILACLCLHPVAYYARTFGGAMVPTDDVIAHLLLMRGDEHLYWRRANHHMPGAPEAGL